MVTKKLRSRSHPRKPRPAGKSFWYHCAKCKPYWRAVATHKRAMLTHDRAKLAYERAQVAYEHARTALAAARDEQDCQGQQLNEAM